MNGDDEAQKQMTRSILAYTLDSIMRMLHPFMPFVTEHIWQNLPVTGDSIVTASWPQVKPELSNEQSKRDMEQLMEIIRAVRNTRSEVNTPMSKQIPMMIKTNNDDIAARLERERPFIERFCNPSELTIQSSVEIPEEVITTAVTGGSVILPLAGLIDMDKEIARLEKELEKWQKELERVDKKLSNEKFVAKAPEKIINEEKEKQALYTEKYNSVQERLNQLNRK